MDEPQRKPTYEELIGRLRAATVQLAHKDAEIADLRAQLNLSRAAHAADMEKTS